MKYKLLILSCCIFFSCNTSKKIAYLQDINYGVPEDVVPYEGIIIQPKDMLLIVVSSKTPELAVSFNLPLVAYFAGSESTSGGESQKLLGYVVDCNGSIDFPILGKIKVSGFTRLQLSELIKQLLIVEDLIKDPVVSTEFINFKVSVLGEVLNPGLYKVNDDRVTILSALGMAGDLTIYGRRDNVIVVREKDNIRTSYSVDLRSRELFNSPAYYLQQNDIVYVEPNSVKSGQSRINENKTLGVWVSMASFITTLAVLLFK